MKETQCFVPVTEASNTATDHTKGTTTTTATATTAAAQRRNVGNINNYWTKSPADMLELIGCVVFCFLCALPALLIDLRERPIPFQSINSGEYMLNQVNNESFESDTISNLLLVCIAVIMPLALQVGLATYWIRSGCGEIHRTVCAYLVGFGLTVLGTESIKRYVGYLRPSFYDLCEATADFRSCTSDASRDARQSFPSGHASVAFCGLYLLSMYLEERAFGISSVTTTQVVKLSSSSIVATEDNETDGGDSRDNLTMMVKYETRSPQLYRLCSVLCLLPLALATYAAASRVVDNRHFPADVVAGAVLGAACARFAHRLWFPSPILSHHHLQ